MEGMRKPRIEPDRHGLIGYLAIGVALGGRKRCHSRDTRAPAQRAQRDSRRLVGNLAVIVGFAAVGGAAIDVGGRKPRVECDRIAFVFYLAVVVALAAFANAAVEVGES